MAKQIKTEEGSLPSAGTATEAGNAPVAEKANISPEEAKPEAHVLAILEAFPNYGKLYVDRHGGIYTPDTPEAIRGTAALYTNPYFKP